MKNFQKALTVFIFILFLTGIITLGGCEKGELDQQSFSSLEQQSIIKDQQILKELEWMVSNNRISQDQYENALRNGPEISFSEGLSGNQSEAYFFNDVIFSREGVQLQMKKVSTDKQARHRRHTNMTGSGAKTIRVQPGVPSDWITAINQAVSEWNALGYTITFGAYSASTATNVTGEIDVVYGSAGLSSTQYAGTQLPNSAGSIGEEIKINSAGPSGTTASAKKFAMTHELGHALGLRHTDTTEGQDVSLSITCNGSVGWTDTNSIMKPNMTITQSWLGFTTCDKAVIDFYW